MYQVFQRIQCLLDQSPLHHEGTRRLVIHVLLIPGNEVVLAGYDARSDHVDKVAGSLRSAHVDHDAAMLVHWYGTG